MFARTHDPLATAAALLALAYAGSLSRQKREATFLLPDGAELILSAPVDNSFVCSDEGIFADVKNNCEIFHKCHITERADGSGADLRQYSFVCGNQTIFNQFSQTCATREESIPCADAPEFYYLNDRVREGRADVHLHTDADVEKAAASIAAARGAAN